MAYFVMFCDMVCGMICAVVFYELVGMVWYSDIVLCYIMRCNTCYVVCHCILQVVLFDSVFKGVVFCDVV